MAKNDGDKTDPKTDPKPASAPETASPAAGPTQVVVTGEPVKQGASAEVTNPEATNYAPSEAYVEAQRVGYFGKTPEPGANAAVKQPAHGSGDLRFAPNAPQASDPGLETPGARAELDPGIAPEGADADNLEQEPPELTPDNWANGPQKEEGETLTPKVLEPEPDKPERGKQA